MNSLKSWLCKLNDDGWRMTTAICLISAGACLSRVSCRGRVAAPAFVAGVIYEQLVEWAAHGWLQSEEVDGFQFFRWRHGRHHRDPANHHALQPLSVWAPVVTALLSPCAALAASKRSPCRVAGFAAMSGFLAAHALLNIIHYDIHSPKKIIPGWLRSTRYFIYVQQVHLAHHAGDDRRLYGITNPWLDQLLEYMGAPKRMDILFQSVGKAAKHLDWLWLSLDPTWRSIVCERQKTISDQSR
jgi:hypothetical protein